MPTEKKSIPQSAQVWEGSSAYVKQGHHWSSAIIWLSSGIFVFLFIWAFVARIDQTISVRGRLQPSGSVREVDSPVTGVVESVHISDGQSVKEGAPLFTVDSQGITSRLSSVTRSLRLYQAQKSELESILYTKTSPSKKVIESETYDVSDPELSQQLTNARRQATQIRSQLIQLNNRIASEQKSLSLLKRIATDYQPLFESGAIARNQYLTQLNRVQESESQLSSLREEESRQRSLAAAQLTDITRNILALNTELATIRETLSYRTVKAPVSGRIFNLQIKKQSVITADQTVLKIIPSSKLEAVVQISNSDIGFVKVGMPANVAIDSFPSGEFGYLTGSVSSIGSDALPPLPTSANPTTTFTFPATISLQEQSVYSGRDKLNLQSGMSLTANIKLRSRPVISIVSDLFTRQMDGVKRFR